MTYFIITFLILFLLLAWKRLDWALQLLLFLLPSYQIRFSVFGLPSTLLEAMILISFAVWMIRDWHVFQKRINQAWQKKRESYRYPFDFEIVGIIFVSWLGIIAAGFSSSALGIWRAYFFEPILVFLMIYNIFGGVNKKEGIGSIINKIMRPLVLSALTVSSVAALQKLGVLSSPANFWPRVTGVWVYPNALGLYVGPLVPLMLGWMLSVKNEKRKIKKYQIIVVFLSLFLSLASLFFASSEGAMIGVLVSFGVMFLFWLAVKVKKKFLYYFNYFIISIILIFVFFSSFIFLYAVPEHKYFNFNSSALNYISDKTMLKDFSGEVRKQQWRETFSMLKDDGRWLWGAGLSSYQKRVAKYHQEGIFFNRDRDPRFYNELVWGPEEYKWKYWQPVEIYMYPHNILLNFWTELGVVGILLTAWIIGKYLVHSIKSFYANSSSDKYLALGLLGAMIVIVVHGLVDVPYFKNDLSVMFWVFVALLGVLLIENQKVNDG